MERVHIHDEFECQISFTVKDYFEKMVRIPHSIYLSLNSYSNTRQKVSSASTVKASNYFYNCVQQASMILIIEPANEEKGKSVAVNCMQNPSRKIFVLSELQSNAFSK